MKDCIDHGQKTPRYAKTTWNKQSMGMHRKVYCVAHNLTADAIKGLIIRHTCDNPRCINPEHLIEGTQQDNIQDCVTQQRHAHGERNGKARLTLEDVLKIRESTLTIKELSLQYNVAPRTIRDVINNVTWRLT